MKKSQLWILIVALTLIVIIVIIGQYRQNAEAEEDRKLALQINLQRLTDYIEARKKNVRIEMPTLIQVD